MRVVEDHDDQAAHEMGCWSMSAARVVGEEARRARALAALFLDGGGGGATETTGSSMRLLSVLSMGSPRSEISFCIIEASEKASVADAGAVRGGAAAAPARATAPAVPAKRAADADDTRSAMEVLRNRRCIAMVLDTGRVVGAVCVTESV